MIFISLLATKDTKISSVWSAFSLNFWCGITAFWAVILTHAAQFQKPADEDATALTFYLPSIPFTKSTLFLYIYVQ